MSDSTIVIVPCYKRPEYTENCIRSLEAAQKYENTLFYLVDDGSKDATQGILGDSKFKWRKVIINPANVGLRNILLDFFQFADSFDYMVKVDNDCIVPKNWLDDTLKLIKEDKADILSPNVIPSNAAFKYGNDDKDNLGYRPSRIVGGLWAMKTSMIKDVQFETIQTSKGIVGAAPLLNQIIVEKEPRIGWLTNVTVQDIGHWSGEHPDHIKSDEHLEYSIEVGRQIGWDK